MKSDEFIENWRLEVTSYGTVLQHTRCPLSGSIGYQPTPSRKVLGHWVCVYCDQAAPEEMSFAADLAQAVDDDELRDMVESKALK